MRITSLKEEIDDNDIRGFFERRAKKFNKDNPYSVTMYQDKNPELIEQRNIQEFERIMPLLDLRRDSRVLDIACGIGRWSDFITTDIDKYCGIDACEEFIQKAIAKNEERKNRFFLYGTTDNLCKCLARNGYEKFNRILMMGILLYLNDDAVQRLLEQVCCICEPDGIICMREPIALNSRLTLKNHYSDELDDMYNAIYRSRQEIEELLKKTYYQQGFVTLKEGFMFDDTLNNRKETAQYYYVMQKKK